MLIDMANVKPFIGIKRLWYGDVIATVTNPETGYSKKELKTQVAKMTEVKNVHQDTWGYDESDASITDYINELTGQPYYRDVTQASSPTINFTIGEYDFATKAALQGGKAGEETWQRQDMTSLIEKSIVAMTKTGNFIVFPKANITGKGTMSEKNVGIGVSAVPLETGVKGLASEIWFDGSKVTLE